MDFPALGPGFSTCAQDRGGPAPGPGPGGDASAGGGGGGQGRAETRGGDGAATEGLVGSATDNILSMIRWDNI